MKGAHNELWPDSAAPHNSIDCLICWIIALVLQLQLVLVHTLRFHQGLFQQQTAVYNKKSSKKH